MEQNTFFEIKTLIFETKKVADERKSNEKLRNCLPQLKSIRWKLHVIDYWWFFKENGNWWKLFLKIIDPSYAECRKHGCYFKTQKSNWRELIWKSKLLQSDSWKNK